MKYFYRLLFLFTLIVAPFMVQGQSNDFRIEQTIKADSLCIDIFYSNDFGSGDTLGSANFRINFDTNSLDPSSVTLDYRGNYDVANNAGYQAMTISPILDTFISLNVFNGNTVGYFPASFPFVDEHVARICIEIKDQCGTSGVSWRLIPTFPGTVVNHYNTAKTLGNRTFSGDDPGFALCGTDDTINVSATDICFGEEDTLIVSEGTMDGYAFYSTIDGYIDTLDKMSQLENYVLTSSLTVGTHGIYAIGYSCSGGCVIHTDTIDVVVSASPISFIEGPDSMCLDADETYFIDDDSVDVFWSFQVGTIGTPSAPYFIDDTAFIDVQWTSPGIDTIVALITDTLTGCTALDSFEIEIFRNPFPDLGNDTIVCGQSSLILDAKVPSANFYQWYEVPGLTLAGENGQTFTATDPIGTYAIEVDSNGLGICSRFDTITVEFVDVADSIMIEDSIVLCDSGFVSLVSDTSNTGFYYYIRENTNNTPVVHPMLGSGFGINFPLFTVNSDSVFNVYAVSENALRFDGIDDHVTIAPTGILNFEYTSQFSIEAWVNLESLTGDHIIFGNAAISSSGYEFRVVNGELGFAVISSTPSNLFDCQTSGAPLAANTWHHVAVTYGGTGDPAGVQFYVDGVPFGANLTSGSNVTATIVAGNTIMMGHRGGSGIFYGPGLMNEVRVWSGVRSMADINSFMFNRADGTEPQLLASYSFESNGGNAIQDETNNNDGVFQNVLTDPDLKWLPGNLGCQKQLSQLIYVYTISNPTPTLNVGFDVTVCEDSIILTSDIATLEGVGRYTWDNGHGDVVGLDEDSTIIYGPDFDAIIFGVDSAGNGCFTYDTVRITFSGLEDHSVDPDTTYICNVEDVFIDLLTSDIGAVYDLRDDFDNSVVIGGVPGDPAGGLISFDLYDQSGSTTYNILATSSSQNGALRFDGVDDYLEGDDTGLPQADEQRTVEFWVNTTATADQTIFSYGSGDDFEIVMESTGVIFVEEGGGNIGNVFGTISINDGVWHHVAVVYEGSEILLYIDGALDDSYSHSFNTSASGQMFVGLSSSGTFGNFVGDIDDIRVWNTARTQGQIDLYNDACLSGVELGLIRYYKLDDGMGSPQALDLTLNADLTLQNMSVDGAWVAGTVVCGINGCTLEMSTLAAVLELPNPVPTLNVTMDSTTCVSGDQISLISDVKTTEFVGRYTWQDGFGNNIGADEDSIGAFGAGYTPIILGVDSAGNGCFKYDTVILRFGELDTLFTVVPDTFLICDSLLVDVELSGSQDKAQYSLRDDADDSVVDGPYVGDFNPVNFSAGMVNATTTYNIVTESIVSSGAISFDGIDDFLDGNDGNLPFDADDRTIEFWFNTGMNNEGAIVSYGQTETFEIGITNSGSGSQIYARNYSTFDVTSTIGTLNDGAWHHVAVTVEAGVFVSFIIDGVFDSTHDVTNPLATTASGNWRVGESIMGGSSYMGLLDELRIYNVAYDESTIMLHMNECLEVTPISNVAYFQFNDGIGSPEAADFLGSNLTLQNMDPATDWVAGNVNCGVAGCTVELPTLIYAIKTPPINAILDYRDDSTICVGDSVELVASFTGEASYEWVLDGARLDSSYEDTANFYQTLGNYFVVIRDTNGCADTSNTRSIMRKEGLKVDLRVFLEGPYNGTDMNADIILAADTAPYAAFSILESQYEDNGGPAFGGVYGITMPPGETIPIDGANEAVDVVALSYRSAPAGPDLDTTYAWLMQDGSVRDFYIPDSVFALACGLADGNYHVVVRHRNHLTVMTANAIGLANTGIPTNIDLTDVTNVSGAFYGFGVVDLGGSGTGPAGMIAGNAFQIMQIDVNDLNLVLRDNNGLPTGYFITDIDLDGGVDAIDWDKTSFNNNQLYFSTTPNP